QPDIALLLLATLRSIPTTADRSKRCPQSQSVPYRHPIASRPAVSYNSASHDLLCRQKSSFRSQSLYLTPPHHPNQFPETRLWFPPTSISDLAVVRPHVV